MVSEERDFFGDEPTHKNCVGFCIYCKDEIEEGDEVTFKGNLYHKDCFLLEHGEEEING